jgi:pectin methylesterase-like acyl-CoA thioesterase
MAGAIITVAPVRGMMSDAQAGPASPRPSVSTPPLTEASASATDASNLEPAGDTVAAEAAPGYITTVIVDQMPGRGDFTTISDAIARAPAGARIHIRPGYYREQLVVNKPLELVGDGPREDIVIDPERGNALVFDTNIGMVRSLTVKQSGSNEFFGSG